MSENRLGGKTAPALQRRRLWLAGCGLLFVVVICVGSIYWAVRRIGDTRAVDEGGSTAVVPDSGTQPEPDTSRETPTIPAASSPEGRIAYVNEEGALNTISAAGDEQHALGQGDAMSFLFPAWSPDGTQIAALGAGDAGGGVYVFADEAGSDGSELYASRSGAPIYLYWQPDGTAVSFIASAEAGLNLLLSPSSGEGDSRLLFAGQPLYWDWLGDDGHLIVHSGPPGSDGRLALIDAEEGDGAANADIADPGFFQAPGFSAGGQYVAFSEFDGAERRLAVRNLDTDDTFRAAHDGAVALGWSPVDERLAYISPQQSARGVAASYYGPLRLLDARSEQVRMLTQERVLAFFWAPDGRSIAYFTLAEGMGEQVAEGQTRQTMARTSGKVRMQHDEVRLTLSLIDADGGDPQHIIDFRPSELFLTQFLPFFDQYALSHHLWSPDSSALVLPLVEDDAAHLYIVPASGRDVRLLVDGQIGFWSPR